VYYEFLRLIISLVETEFQNELDEMFWRYWTFVIELYGYPVKFCVNKMGEMGDCISRLGEGPTSARWGMWGTASTVGGRLCVSGI